MNNSRVGVLCSWPYMGTRNFGAPKFWREKAERFLNKGKLVQATRGHNLVLFLGARTSAAIWKVVSHENTNWFCICRRCTNSTFRSGSRFALKGIAAIRSWNSVMNAANCPKSGYDLKCCEIFLTYTWILSLHASAIFSIIPDYIAYYLTSPFHLFSWSSGSFFPSTW